MTKRGFTLVELLVVIAIIALLSTVVLVSIQETYRHARNTERIQEMRQIMIALELARSTEGHYPCSGQQYSTDPGGTFLKYLVDHDYLTDTPVDPINDFSLALSEGLWPYTYMSFSDRAGNCGTFYHLEFSTETAKPVGSSCNLMGGQGIWIGNPPTHCHLFYPSAPPCIHLNYFAADAIPNIGPPFPTCRGLLDDEHGEIDNFGYN